MREYTKQQEEFYERRYNGRHDLNLGEGHYANWFSWDPDRELNPQYENVPAIERAGIQIFHRRPDGKACIGAVSFEAPNHPYNPRVSWTVESMDPLTISPSVLCECGDHGFIREGKWVTA